MQERNDHQKVVKLVLILQIITICLIIYFTVYALIKNKQYQEDRQEYRKMMLSYQKEMDQYVEITKQYKQMIQQAESDKLYKLGRDYNIEVNREDISLVSGRVIKAGEKLGVIEIIPSLDRLGQAALESCVIEEQLGMPAIFDRQDENGALIEGFNWFKVSERTESDNKGNNYKIIDVKILSSNEIKTCYIRENIPRKQ